MATQESTAFASGVTTLSVKRGRCALPKEVVEAWKLGTRQDDEKLIAELIAEGHIRLHRWGDVNSRMDRIRRDAEREDDPATQELLLRAYYDRFREAGFSVADNNRLTLSQPLVLAITGGSTPEVRPAERKSGPKVKLYVELAFNAVDILTNEARMRRQPEED